MDQNTPKKTGGISVETEHIFPIIKKWLYSEKDIFLREIVSNATDAVTKLRRLASLGHYSAEETSYRIEVVLDKTARTLTVSDNGIGMTEDELQRYICSIALSGALEFIQTYETASDGKEEANKNGIIGHFGLGFYSSFMVSDTVEIHTRSYTGAPAVHWTCSDAGNYTIDTSDKDGHGTDVIMHIADGEEEYLDSAKLRSMLEKYCSFMPVEIYFRDEAEADTDDSESKEPAAEQPINDTAPLWQKSPSECTDEEYKDFYRKVFHDFKEPLFQIHINADYPLNFRGILYFPRFQNQYESIEGQVKLYYNQVFVADNIKEVIPDYLLMLKGVLDCPELPLNVSRSYLQNNTYVAKVSAHIVKKVADKLNSLCSNDREAYEKVWDSIRAFVEYACMKDKKFYDRVKESILFQLNDNSHVTLQEYLDAAKETNENVVYYATDTALQAQYIKMFEDQGIRVAVFPQLIDSQFATLLENYNEGVKFVRVDADLADAMKSGEEAVSNDDLAALFKKVSGNEELPVKFENLKSDLPALLNVSEESRRMEEMMRMYQMAGDDNTFNFPVEMALVVNTSSPLTQKLITLLGSDDEKAEMIARHIYKLSLLSQRKFTPVEMQEFLSDGFDILSKL